jgi:hypothetical protein
VHNAKRAADAALPGRAVRLLLEKMMVMMVVMPPLVMMMMSVVVVMAVHAVSRRRLDGAGEANSG